MAKYAKAASPHFDPRKHLKKIGLANQTTMYKKETQAIGKLFEKTMMAAFGPENVKQHFAAFDTICDATQVRQDAVNEMSDSALDEKQPDLDFILVVGGWDSSNTAHLLEIPHEKGLLGYHVNTAQVSRMHSTHALFFFFAFPPLTLSLSAYCSASGPTTRSSTATSMATSSSRPTSSRSTAPHASASLLAPPRQIALYRSALSRSCS